VLSGRQHLRDPEPDLLRRVEVRERRVHHLREQQPGVNFTNVLRAAFTLINPESVKKIENLTVSFTLLGSALIKAVCRTLMKLSPGL